MDVTLWTDEGRFHYRVAAVILHDGKILAMRDERSSFYYLPGGRVSIGETAENAIKRELREELDIDAGIIRPLWVHQNFYTDDVDRQDYHILCLYFLIDAEKTDLFSRGESFTHHDQNHIHRFEWLDCERLEEEYFYPLFLKKAILHLPEHLELLTTVE